MWLPRGRRRKVFLVCLATFLLLCVILELSQKIQQKRSLLLEQFQNIQQKPSLLLEKTQQKPPESSRNRTFTIDYENDTFRMDGEPFRFVSGSLHYFRTPRSKWRHIMKAMRYAGLNALSTYTEWSYHEATPEEYDFQGPRDLDYFLQLAAEENLFILFRPGPFISAERDFGGLPPWLLSVEPDIQLRRNNDAYQGYVLRWFQELFRIVEKHLYGNGGQIIMVQVENEYGSVKDCDPDHVRWLRDLLLSFIGDKAVLYSTDGAYEEYLECTVEGVYPTLDFTVFQDTKKSFAAQRVHAPHGPLVNSEFYTGWLTHWGDNFIEVVDSDLLVKSLEELLSLGASVNLYMFHGGTNFGFTSGAHVNDNGSYASCLTSYDYDAPLTEAGDSTLKYYALKKLIGRYLPLPEMQVPEITERGVFENIKLDPIMSVFELALKTEPVFSELPLSFEELFWQHGFVLYETKAPVSCSSCLLEVTQFHDRITIFLDETFISHLLRGVQTSVTLSPRKGQKLSLLVENLGRVSQGNIYDLKGILSSVRLGSKNLTNWNHFKISLKDLSVLEEASSKSFEYINPTLFVPFFYSGTFNVPQISDTFLDMRSWSKGIVFINGHNLGRYWNEMGPQYSLFVPQDFLVQGTNKITIFEQQIPINRSITFCRDPILKYYLSPEQ